MKSLKITISFLLTLFFIGCSKPLFNTNGESIYKSGKTLAGEHMLDEHRSQTALFKSCNGCHGPSGTRIRSCNIQWTHLTDSTKMTVPYTRELFYRFLNDDLKSDGTKARTGVHWQMTDEDKDDLITYLKTLK